MARGDIAKSYVGNKLQKAFGEDFIGYIDKKYYLWANDGGEKVQIAISMTCPKTPVSAGSIPKSNVGLDFSEPAKPAEISEKEQQDILNLMRKLGLE